MDTTIQPPSTQRPSPPPAPAPLVPIKAPYPTTAPAHASDLEQLGERIAELAMQISTATYQLLTMVREFDEGYGWEGFRTCAHWLSWRTGLAIGPAREKVRVGKALVQLPRMSAAMSGGRISYSKVRALTRIATPENEEDLLQVAAAGTASHVESLVRAWRQLERPDGEGSEQAQEAERHASRYFETHTDEDGMLVVRGRLEPEAGAAVVRALEAASQMLYEEEQERSTPSRDSVPVSQRRADAIGLLAEAALSGGLNDDPEKGTRGYRYQVVVHVDAAVLEDPQAAGESAIEGTGGRVAPGSYLPSRRPVLS